jgi:hypothetical protein
MSTNTVSVLLGAGGGFGPRHDFPAESAPSRLRWETSTVTGSWTLVANYVAAVSAS